MASTDATSQESRIRAARSWRASAESLLQEPVLLVGDPPLERSPAIGGKAR